MVDAIRHKIADSAHQHEQLSADQRLGFSYRPEIDPLVFSFISEHSSEILEDGGDWKLFSSS